MDTFLLILTMKTNLFKDFKDPKWFIWSQEICPELYIEADTAVKYKLHHNDVIVSAALMFLEH